MGGMNEKKSNYWLDQLADEIMAKHPKGEIVVESGHAPSGYYHLGTLREILTASAIAWRLEQAGREARHVDFIDDFDALRKIPNGIDESFRKYIGWPLYLVPDPTGEHESWAQWLLSGLFNGLKELGIRADVRLASKEYPMGTFTEQIEQVLRTQKRGHDILTEVTGRQLPETWSPVQILSDSNSLREWNFTGWDEKRKVVFWRDPNGKTGEVSYLGGRVKLDWRFDWPARWAKLGVDVEPFGRDHATKGGSYDSGVRIIREIFDSEPPMPVPYEFINRVGETKKMSKSAGDVVTVSGALEIMPAEIIRYFVLKPMPSRTLYFDEGVGLVNMIDEYAKLQESVDAGESPEFEEAYRVASVPTKVKTISRVPFGHLAQCYQAAGRDLNRAIELLVRSGYEAAVRDQKEVIEREFAFCGNWLDKYAPERMKFELKTDMPDVRLEPEQKEMLRKLASVLEKNPDLNGQGVHDAIYAASEEAGLKGARAFAAIYLVLLGQDFGPKAGWFVSSLPGDFVINRFKEASN
jgi:lysyl-tRNA synthetase, class I